MEQIIDGPLAFDSQTVFSAPTHFSLGCDYTIALNVWLWKPRYRDLNIFATRRAKSDNSTDTSDNLEPAIMFNTGTYKDEFFFSARKDENGGPSGCWSKTKVNHYEWTHLALTIKGELLTGYVNGKAVGTVTFTDKVDQTCEYTDAEEVVDNKIMQVFGDVSKKSTTGMVHDVLVFRNIVLNAEEIAYLLKLRPPPVMQTLDWLLTYYNVRVDERRGTNTDTDDDVVNLEYTDDLFSDYDAAGGDQDEIVVKRLQPIQDVSAASGTGVMAVSHLPNLIQNNPSRRELGVKPSISMVDKGMIKEGGNENDYKSTWEYFTSELGDTWNKIAHKLSNKTIPVSYHNQSDNHNIYMDYSDIPFKSTKEKVQDLYDSSMIWLNGRYEHIVENTQYSLDEWKLGVFEAAQSAQFLSLWMASDLAKQEEKDVQWPHKYSTMLAQPVHLALGYRAGFEDVLSPSGASPVPKPPSDSMLLPRTSDSERFLQHVDDELLSVLAPESFYTRESQPMIADTDTRGALDRICRDEGCEEEEDESMEYGDVGLMVLPDELEADMIPLTEEQQHEQFLREIEAYKASQKSLANNKPTNDQSLSKSDTSPRESVLTLISTPRGNAYQNECPVAAAYYFPVSQYVTSHSNMVNVGVGSLEVVKLRTDNLAGRHGVADEVTQLREVKAEEGDIDSLLFMARRHFHGYGGLERNPVIALRYYRMAADADNSEGLYNMGVFYENGQAGLQLDKMEAFRYMQKAAKHKRPFRMAVERMGHFYLGFNQLFSVDVVRAKWWFEKAADMNSAEAHNSLGEMLLDPSKGIMDVPQAVVHLAQAATWGHIRATNNLAQALLDPDSWLGNYERSQRLHRILVDRGEAPTSPTPPSRSSTRWTYHDDAPIVVYLPHGSAVPLPFPLATSCQAALKLLKYVSEKSYRTNELNRAAMKAYFGGDLWLALDYYDEMSELGVEFAQDNSAFLYETLMHQECGASDWNRLFDMTTESIVVEGFARQHFEPTSQNDECFRFYERATSRRWTQLAKSGDSRATRELASQIASSHYPFDQLSPVYALDLFAFSAKRGDVQSLMSLGWIYQSGSAGVTKNLTAAKLLFRKARLLEMTEPYRDAGYRSSANTHTPSTTAGLAPILAESFVDLELFVTGPLGVSEELFDDTFRSWHFDRSHSGAFLPRTFLKNTTNDNGCNFGLSDTFDMDNIMRCVDDTWHSIVVLLIALVSIWALRQLLKVFKKQQRS